MRAHYLFLVCLALLAAPSRAADAQPKDADADAAAAELLEVSESTNNNTAAAEEDDLPSTEEAGERKTNSKRTIDHNLGYGYRYNTVLRPVSSPLISSSMSSQMHLSRPSMRPYSNYFNQPMYKPRYQASLPAPHFTTQFRYSQPLPMPQEKPQETRPVTEAPTSQETGYRTLPQQETAPQTFSFEEDAKAPEGSSAPSPFESAVPAPEQAQAHPHPQHHALLSSPSYQQVLQQIQLQQSAAEPSYFLAPTGTASPMYAHHAAGAMFPGTTPTPLVHIHGAASTHAPQMIPILIVRVMDPQAAASAHPYSFAQPAMPYPLMNMQILRDYLGKLYTPQPAVQPALHYMTAADPEALMYLTGAERPSSLYRAAQLQKLHLQQQLHAQLQQQLQQQQQQHQQHQLQQQQQRQSAAAVLQEQHRQRVAAAQGRTEVSVHHSSGMTPQDYKDSVEQQDES